MEKHTFQRYGTVGAIIGKINWRLSCIPKLESQLSLLILSDITFVSSAPIIYFDLLNLSKI